MDTLDSYSDNFHTFSDKIQEGTLATPTHLFPFLEGNMTRQGEELTHETGQSHTALEKTLAGGKKEFDPSHSYPEGQERGEPKTWYSVRRVILFSFIFFITAWTHVSLLRVFA